jgi:hypothetical protein
MSYKIEAYVNRFGGVIHLIQMGETMRPSECCKAFKALRDNAERLHDDRAGLEYIEVANGGLRVVLEQGPRNKARKI